MPSRRIILVVLGVVALAMSVLQVNVPAGQGQSASRDIATSATVVYVSLRAVNAALSVSQEVELGASAVASASAKPLKVLDPVDDTIERIASVVFAIAALSWVLSVAFQPVAAIGFGVLGLGLFGLAFAERFPSASSIAKVATRLGLVFAVLLPLVYAGGAFLGRVATDSVRVEATATLETIAEEARRLIGRDTEPSEAPSEAEEGWFSGILDGAGQVRDQVSQFTSAADYYWSNADVILEAAFTLIAVFVLRILVMPLLLLILMWRLMRGLV